jgi:hypothetical protein
MTYKKERGDLTYKKQPGAMTYKKQPGAMTYKNESVVPVAPKHTFKLYFVCHT